MNNERVSFADLTLELPPEWLDVTDDLEGEVPFTLGRTEEAVGALQFSVALFREGKPPEFNPEALMRLLRQFFEKKGFGDPTDVREWTGETFGVCGNHCAGEDHYRIWYVSDGKNLAMVSHTTKTKSDPFFPRELKEAESIVRSIEF